MNGEPGALSRVVLCTAGRAALLAAGMYAGGKRENLTRDAVAGALGIEAFVLAWAAWQNHG